MQKYINNIDDCLLTTFSEVMRAHNYKLLLISGEYDEKLASDAWLELYDQYNEVVSSKSTNIQYEITKQIDIKKSEYVYIKQCLFFILEWNNIILLDMFDLVDNKENYINLIDDLINKVNEFNYRFDKSKGIGVEVTRISKQIENYKTKIEVDLEQLKKLGGETNEWTFDDTIGGVEKYMTFPMPEKLKLRMFTVYLNMLIKSNAENKTK